MNVEGFAFQPPPGFRTEEHTVALRLPLGSATPGPSLIVQSKLVRAGSTLGDLATSTFAELAANVPKMKHASQSELTFADGGLGVVLAYSFPTQAGELRQYFALRLHGERLCSITLTVPTAGLNESTAKTYLSAITSITPA